MPNPNPNPETRYKTAADSPGYAAAPFTVRLPLDIDGLVRARGLNWVRAVLRRAIEEEDEKNGSNP
jgi:hypothetical protein